MKKVTVLFPGETRFEGELIEKAQDYVMGQKFYVQCLDPNHRIMSRNSGKVWIPAKYCREEVETKE